jgi:hypothetical protein
MTDEEDLDGSGCGLIVVLSWHLWEKLKETSAGFAGFEAETQSGHLSDTSEKCK